MATEARINKSEVPTASFSEQAGVGLYFEFTHYTCQIDPFSGAEVLVDNVALFALDGQLWRKDRTGSITASPNVPANIAPIDNEQPTWRRVENTDRTTAFLAVMRAWEFATQRPVKAQHEMTAAGGDPTIVTVAAHWLASEPLFWPVTDAELERARKGEDVSAIAEAAETFWLQIASALTFDDGTPGHRVPGDTVRLDTSMLHGKVMRDVLAEASTVHPKFADAVSTATAALPSELLTPISS